MGYEKLCKTSEIAEGTMKGFTVKGKQILIANADGKFHAINAICSHSYGYLPMGKLEGKNVVCPVHQAKFDVTSGQVTKNVGALIKLATKKGAKDLPVYNVKVEDDSILVDVS